MRSTPLLALLLIGCEGTPWKVGGAATTRDCAECHGRRSSESALEEIVDDIIDTHFDDQRIDAEGNFITGETPQYEGYVFAEAVAWAEPGLGYVVAGAENECAASCHDGHASEVHINHQWSHSGHGDVNAEAWDREFPSGACLQCHSSVGWAKWLSAPAFPGFVPPDDLHGAMLSCNGCHDGSGFPSHEDSRLRYTDTQVLLRSGSAPTGTNPNDTRVTDGVIDVPRGALCATCHQARQSGGSTYKRLLLAGADPYVSSPPDMVFGVAFGDIDSHGGHAGANMYSFKGWEYPGKTYTNGNVMHQNTGCIGCHMFEGYEGYEETERGGHTFHPAGCERCHGVDWEEFDTAGRLIDVDGDGAVGYPKAELASLVQLLVDELASRDKYYGDHYPYFFVTDDPAEQNFGNAVFVWTEAEILAAFNLHYVNDDPGIFVHNFRYAAQLLRDSYEDLTGVTLDGSRPGTAEDRPARDFSDL